MSAFFRLAAATLVAASCSVADAADPLAFPIGESPLEARLAGIDPQWNISLRAGGKIRVVRAGDLAYWGRYRDVEAGPQMLLADGSMIRSDLLKLDEQQVVLGDATGLGRGQWDESTLPRAAVTALIWQPPADNAQRDRLLAALSRAEGTDDRVLLVGGESLSGTFTAAPVAGRFAPEDARPGGDTFELVRRGQAQPLKIASAKVVAIRFAGAVLPPAAGEMSAWLGLHDGSLVRVKQIGVKGDVVTLHLAAGGQLLTTLVGRKDASLKFWDEVTYLEPASPRVMWISDLRSLGYRHIPFVTVERPLGLDQSVLGNRLRADGSVARKGIGMPSAARLAIDCNGYRRFEAEIALDDSAELQGSVTCKVLLQSAAGEWSPAYESPVIRGGDAPRQIAIDLGGAERLAILVDFSDRGDARDWLNGLHARLTK